MKKKECLNELCSSGFGREKLKRETFKIDQNLQSKKVSFSGKSATRKSTQNANSSMTLQLNNIPNNKQHKN